MGRFIIVSFLTVLWGGLSPAVEAQVDPGKGEILVMGRTMASLQQAFNMVPTGGTIRIGPGTYKMAGKLKNRNGVSIYGSVGTVFDGVATDGKATFVIASNDITIEDITCRNVKVPDRNGACVRFEGTNLTLRRVTFENSENGLLANKQSGEILIEDSIFRGNGAAGRAHGMYINGGRLTVRRTQVLGSKDEGHGIKSRAELTIIEDSVIASMEGNDSRLIDISDGGMVSIRNNLLVEGAKTANWQLLSYGVESVRYSQNLFRMENNLIITDRPGGSELILIGKGLKPKVRIEKNLIVGRINYDWPESNIFFEDRKELNLPPPGKLPEWDSLGKK